MTEDDGLVRVQRELQRLAGVRGSLNGSRLVRRLADGLAVSHLEVRHNLLALARAGVVDNIGPTGDPLGRVSILQRLPEPVLHVPEHERQWRDLVSARNLDPALESALGDAAIGLAGLSRGDMEHLLEGFLRLVADRDRFAGRDPYEVSAKYLLGSSKILAKLGKALSVAGISESIFGARPRHMLGAGPAHSTFTLLVENPECFERLVGLGLADRITVIATYGYGITWSGVGVEGRLDRIKIARVAGTPPATLAGSVASATCSFWGDLDQAGLDIFIKLRGLIPHLALSALYGPMLTAAANDATSHPYCGVVDKVGQIETVSNDDTVNRLAAACRLRAVDQEFVSDPDILGLAELLLEEPGQDGVGMFQQAQN
jgi:hypothetical protein